MNDIDRAEVSMIVAFLLLGLKQMGIRPNPMAAVACRIVAKLLSDKEWAMKFSSMTTDEAMKVIDEEISFFTVDMEL